MRQPHALPNRKAIPLDLVKQATDDEEMALINRYALEPLNPETIFAGKMHLANSRVDRTYERFTKAILERFAETIPGKSVLKGHSHYSLPVGRFYAASVEKAGDEHVLVARYYMRAAGEMAEDVRAGVIKDVSIGFRADKRICDLCGKDYDRWYYTLSADEDEDPSCRHIAGREYGGKTCTLTYGGDLTKYEAQEGSFVWLGAQYDAETAKAEADLIVAKEAWLSQSTDPGKETRMEIKEALVEIDRLKAENARLAADAEAAKQYREHLKAEIARLCAATKQDAMAPVILAMAENAPVSDLQNVVRGLQLTFDSMFPPPGQADPNARAADSEPVGEFDPSKRAPMPWEKR